MGEGFNILFFCMNIVGILFFLGIAYVCSADRKHIHWVSIGLMLLINLILAAVLTLFSWGRAAVEACANGFSELVSVADKGISFAFGWWASSVFSSAPGHTGALQVASSTVDNHLIFQMQPGSATFIVAALLPILLVVPLFDTLTYIGVLPWIIKWIGRGLSFVTRQPQFEAFYAVEMMFLGNTEALAVSKLQLQKMNARRNVTLAFMSMSCVTASILAAYVQMVPGQFVMTAVPLNCVNALLIANMLYPVTVDPDEDVIYQLGDEDKTPQQIAAERVAARKGAKFFGFLGGKKKAQPQENAVSTATSETMTSTEKDAIAEEILKEDKDLAKKGVLSPSEQTEASAAYAALPWWKRLFKRNPATPKREPYFSFLGDSILGSGKLILIIIANVIAFVALAAFINLVLGFIWKPLSLQSIIGVFLYIPSLFLGLDWHTAWEMAQYMGLKLVTNEFVVMGEVHPIINGFAPHYRAVLTVFLTSFCNFSTLGMVIGAFKSLVNKEKNDVIAKEIARMFLSGILVSLLSASFVGLFVW